MDMKKRLLDLKEGMDHILTKRVQIIICISTLFLSILSIYSVVTETIPEVISYVIYVAAGVGFFCSLAIWIKAIKFFVNVVIIPFSKTNRVVSTLVADIRLRTVMFTLPGLVINLAYAIFNGAIGIANKSAWCGSLAAYYMLLWIMRLLSVSYARRVYDGSFLLEDRKKIKIEDDEEELEKRSRKVHKNCGILLALSAVAMGGAVIMLVYGEGGNSYPGFTIYAIAAYTFYKLIMSIYNMITSRKKNSLLLKTLRYINYADALVSLLSLQTALFAAFGSGAGAMIEYFNACTGGAVCLMIFALGIFMCTNAKKVTIKEK